MMTRRSPRLVRVSATHFLNADYWPSEDAHFKEQITPRVKEGAEKKGISAGGGRDQIKSSVSRQNPLQSEEPNSGRQIAFLSMSRDT